MIGLPTAVARGDAAGADRPAIDVHRARAALPDAAAELGAGQPDVIADHPQQRRLRVRVDGMHVPLTVRSNAIPSSGWRNCSRRPAVTTTWNAEPAESAERPHPVVSVCSACSALIVVTLPNRSLDDLDVHAVRIVDVKPVFDVLLWRQPMRLERLGDGRAVEPFDGNREVIDGAGRRFLAQRDDGAPAPRRRILCSLSSLIGARPNPD